jgi:hypothetical protein
MIRDGHTSLRLREPLEARFSTLVAWVEALAFWAAVAFPVMYVTGYLAMYVLPESSIPSAVVLAGLLGGHVIALIVGRGYKSGSARPASGL